MRILLLLIMILSTSMASAGIEIREKPSRNNEVTDNNAFDGIKMNSVAILDKTHNKKLIYINHGSGQKEYGRPGKISVVSSGSRRTATGTMEVWAQIKSKIDSPAQIKCRVQFFDMNELPVENPTAWQTIFIQPNSVNTYREFSINVRDVRFYYIEIMEGR